MRPPLILRASPSKEEVYCTFQSEKDVKMRARLQAIFLLLDGHNAEEVGTIVGYHSRTIYAWATRYNARGLDGLISKSIPGREPRLNFGQYLALEEDISKSPRELGYDFASWDGKKVMYHIEKKFGVKLKVRQVENILHLLEFSLQRPRPRAAKADPAKQAAFRQDLAKKRTMAPSAPTTA